jgi:predicted Zn finger-like uncharacterized protein
MKIECPKCGASFRVLNPVSVSGGKQGGKAKVRKGFASKAVQDKAQATLKARRLAGQHE